MQVSRNIGRVAWTPDERVESPGHGTRASGMMPVSAHHLQRAQQWLPTAVLP